MARTEKSQQPAQRHTIQSLERGLSILELLADSPGPLSVVEICRSIGVQRTTLYALLNTLVDRGYVEKEAAARYAISGRLYELGRSYPDRIPLTRYAKQHVNHLSGKFDVWARVSYINADLEIVTAYFSSNVKYGQQIVLKGVPLHVSSAGKLLCAHTDFDTVCAKLLVFPLARMTANTITDLDALREELAGIRARGYATDNGEYLENTACISFPVFDAGNRLGGILSVSADYQDMKRQYPDVLREGLQAAKTVSMDLGWNPGDYAEIK